MHRRRRPRRCGALSRPLKLIDYPWDAERALKARQEFTDYRQPVLEKRRLEPGDDVLSVLACAEVDGDRLENEEMRRELETAIKVLFERHPSMELVDPDGTLVTGCVLRVPKELRVRLGSR